MKKKVCVILGAGASADAWNNGGPIPRNDEWRPPLARELSGLEIVQPSGLSRKAIQLFESSPRN